MVRVASSGGSGGGGVLATGRRRRLTWPHPGVACSTAARAALLSTSTSPTSTLSRLPLWAGDQAASDMLPVGLLTATFSETDIGCNAIRCVWVCVTQAQLAPLFLGPTVPPRPVCTALLEIKCWVLLGQSRAPTRSVEQWCSHHWSPSSTSGLGCSKAAGWTGMLRGRAVAVLAALALLAGLAAADEHNHRVSLGGGSPRSRAC